MGRSPQRRWKLFCLRQLPGGGSNLHFKPWNPRSQWGPPASPMVGVHVVAPGSRKADGEAESDPSASFTSRSRAGELTRDEAGRRVAPFVELTGRGASGVWTRPAPRAGVAAQVWTHTRQAVLLAFLSVLSSGNTESRRLQVRGGRDPQVLTSLTCLHRSPPVGPCFLQFLFSQQTLFGNECVYSAQFKDARTHSFIRLLLRCLALWRLLNLLSENTFL